MGELPSSSCNRDPVCAGGVDGRSWFSFFFSSFFFVSPDAEAALLGSEACFFPSVGSPPGCIVDFPSFEVMFSENVIAGQTSSARRHWSTEWCEITYFDFEAVVGMVVLYVDRQWIDQS